MWQGATIALTAALFCSAQLSLALNLGGNARTSRPFRKKHGSASKNVEKESLTGTPASHEASEELACAVDTNTVVGDKANGWQMFHQKNFTPFGTVFPQSWAPMCPCSDVTPDTKDLVKFNAFRKCGTKLAIRGGQCIGSYLRRMAPEHAVSIRAACGHGCIDPEIMPLLKEVWWTRAPTDWLISSYLYQRRDDEPLRCYLNQLKREIESIRKIKPNQPAPSAEDITYGDYLKRISEEDGLFIEMYRTAHVNQVSSINQVVVAAYEGMKGPNRLKVCLEDFMRSPESFQETWKKVLRFTTGNTSDRLGDKQLQQCLAKQNVARQKESRANKFTAVSTQASNHGTTIGVLHSDLQRMRSAIQDMDVVHFNGLFAKAGKEIGCDELTAPKHSQREMLILD